MTVSLITGANKGLGFETARLLVESGQTVYLGARSADRGRRAAADIGARFVQLDVTSDASVAAAAARIDDEEGRLDLLVNNAGIADDARDGTTVLRVFDTNAVGIVRMTEAVLPLLQRSDDPRVVTISSSAGSFWAATTPDRPEFGLFVPAYAASKAAATMLTVQYAKAHPSIRFTAVEPGFTATDLTAHMPGGRAAAESARFVVDVATGGSDVVSGALLDDHGVLAW